MQSTTYYEVLDRAQQLTSADQLRLLEELIALVRHKITTQSRRSIMELQGLGKKIWQDIDAKEYVDKERASWNG